MVAELPKEELPVGDIVEQNLPALFKTYPNLTATKPSSWFVWNDDDKVDIRLSKVCHTEMPGQGTGWDDLITAIPKSDKISIAYQRMLINGPFKAYSDLIQLKNSPILKKDKTKVVTIDRYYSHVTSLIDWPANVLFNYCMATRIPIEKPEWLKPWWKGVEMGFNPTLAFLLSFSTNGEPFNGTRFKKYVSNHSWFDNSSNWSSIIKGEMVRQSKSFKINPSSCRPSNVIWGSSRETAKYVNMTAEQISDALGLPIEPPAADLPKPAARPKKAPNKKYFMPPIKPFAAANNAAMDQYNFDMKFYKAEMAKFKKAVADEIHPMPLIPIHPIIPQVHDEVAVDVPLGNLGDILWNNNNLLNVQPAKPFGFDVLVNFEDIQIAHAAPQPEINDEEPLDQFEWGDDDPDEDNDF